MGAQDELDSADPPFALGSRVTLALSWASMMAAVRIRSEYSSRESACVVWEPSGNGDG